VSRCEHRVYALDHGIDEARPIREQLTEVRCEAQATKTYVFTVPRLIEVHGESEELCAEHHARQRQVEDVHRYLATPQGHAELFADPGTGGAE
jgi:hypothetical protein